MEKLGNNFKSFDRAAVEKYLKGFDTSNVVKKVGIPGFDPSLATEKLKNLSKDCIDIKFNKIMPKKSFRQELIGVIKKLK